MHGYFWSNLFPERKAQNSQLILHVTAYCTTGCYVKWMVKQAVLGWKSGQCYRAFLPYVGALVFEIRFQTRIKNHG